MNQPTSKSNQKSKSSRRDSVGKAVADKRLISEMRNLGPACEKDFNAIGITFAGQLIALGPEQAFIKMLLGRKKLGRSAKCCNAAYLYAIYGAINDLDWRELPEKKRAEFKTLAAEMRESGQFTW